MLSLILGYHNDSKLSEVVLAIMSDIFSALASLSIDFNFAQFLVYAMHFQLTIFEGGQNVLLLVLIITIDSIFLS